MLLNILAVAVSTASVLKAKLSSMPNRIATLSDLAAQLLKQYEIERAVYFSGICTDTVLPGKFYMDESN